MVEDQLPQELFVVCFINTAAAGVLSWKADRDYMLRFVNSGGQFVLALINQSYATWVTPSQVYKDSVLFASVSSTSVRVEINRMIFKDQSLFYCNSGVAGSTTLFLLPL